MCLVLLGDDMDLLGVTADSKLNFDMHVAKICRKVSQQVTVFKRMEKTLPFKIHMKLSTKHLLFLISIIFYCTETWHFCTKHTSDKLEKINEKTLHFVYLDNSSSYKMLLKPWPTNTVKSETCYDTDYSL